MTAPASQPNPPPTCHSSLVTRHSPEGRPAFRPETAETAIASDLGALRTIIRHLDILAEDYAADFDLRNSLRRAARWSARARDALQKHNPTNPKQP